MTTTVLAPASAPAMSPAQQEPEPTRRLFTVDEYCAMAEAGILKECERVELLDGEIIAMPPLGAPHESGTDQLNSEMAYLLHGRAFVRVQGSVRLNDDSLPQPDISILRRRPGYQLERATAEDVLLLVEVADTTLAFDRDVKLPRYAAAGIPEVWIANVRARQVEAYSDPVDGVYRSRRVVTADGNISPLAFPDVSLAVADFLLA